MRPGFFWAAAGCALAAVALTVWRIHGLTLSTLHSACSSGWGTLGQAVSARFASDCSNVSLGLDARDALVIAAVLLVIVGVVARPVARVPLPPAPPPPPPPVGWH
jgi:hypothetical protein